MAYSRILCPVILALCVIASGCRDKQITRYQIPKEDDAPAPAFADESKPVNQPTGTLTWTLPQGWESKPASGMRVATFVVQGVSTDALDISVVSFPGDGGDDLANVNRWRGQVGLNPLTQDQLSSALLPIQSAAGTLQLTDSAGSATGGKPAKRMLAAWLRLGGKAWFFKLLGEPAAVNDQKNNFVSFLKSLNASASVVPVAATPPLIGAPMDMSSTAVPTSDGASLLWTPNKAWTLKPAVAMRKATFSAGEAEIAISAFPGDVGGPLANVNRWRNQVGLSAIDQAELDKTSTTLEVHGLHFMVIEAVGTNSKAIVAALLPWNGSTWFFKLTGSKDAVMAQKTAFTEFLKSVKTP